MGDEQQRAVEGGQRLLQLLDGGQVEVVGGLVEHEGVDPARRQQRQHRPRPLAGRQRRQRPVHLVGPEPELGQQRAGLADGPPRHGRERARQRAVGGEQRPGLVQLADHHARPEPGLAGHRREPAEHRLQQRRLAAAVGTHEGHPVAPGHLQVDRPQPEAPTLHDGAVQAGHDVAAAAGLGDGEAQLPALPGLVDGDRGAPSPAPYAGRRRQRASALAIRPRFTFLSGSGFLTARVTPFCDHARWRRARSLRPSRWST